MTSQPRGLPVVYLDTTEFDPDVVTLDALARFALEVRRCGYRLLLRGVSPELAGLIDLAGLNDALPVDPLSPGSTPPRC